jgi:hypothetical protein
MSMSAAVRALPDRTFEITAGDRVVTLRAKSIRHALSSAQQRYGAGYADQYIDNVRVIQSGAKLAEHGDPYSCADLGHEGVDATSCTNPSEHKK